MPKTKLPKISNSGPRQQLVSVPYAYKAGSSTMTFKKYDSGWFYCEEQGTYLLTHNLGTTNIIAHLYFATDDSGSNMSTIYGSFFHGDSISGGNIQDITTTQLTVQAARNRGVVRLLDSDGNFITYQTGYYRVIAIALE